MNMKSQTDSVPRFKRGHIKHITLSAFAALALIACSQSTDQSTSEPSQNAYEVEGDHAIGNPDAKVTIVEYASVTCGHCANWHTTVYPDFKAQYVDTGKVRFIFREFPTAPQRLAHTGFLIANCADESKFFDNISLQFKRQRQIFKAAGERTVRQEYVNIAKSAGLSEDEFVACLSNEEENARYEAVIQGGIDAGVDATPTFFVNGEKKQMFTLESIQEVISPLLGEPVPKKSEDSEKELEKETGH